MDICNRLINIFYLENKQIQIFYNNEAYQLNTEINTDIWHFNFDWLEHFFFTAIIIHPFQWLDSNNQHMLVQSTHLIWAFHRLYQILPMVEPHRSTKTNKLNNQTDKLLLIWWKQFAILLLSEKKNICTISIVQISGGNDWVKLFYYRIVNNISG